MNRRIGTALFLAFFFISILIRIPHDRASKATKTVESRKGAREKILLSLMAIGIFLLPLVSLTPLLAFADRELHEADAAIGVLPMLDRFGRPYEEYRSRTKRLIPEIW